MKSPSCLLLTIMFMLIKHSLQINEKHRSTKEDIQMKLLQPLPSDIDSIMAEYGDDEAMKDLITRLGAVSMFSYPAPAGPAIGIVLTLFVEMLLSYRYKSEPEAPIDTKKFAKSIRNLQTFINKESDRVIEKLEETIYDEMLVNKFRNSLNSLNSCHKNSCYNCFVKRNCSSDDKKYINESLINPTSPYRIKLSELVPNFIQSQETPLDQIESPMRIFDYIIWKHKSKKNQHLYCNNTVSEHKKIVQIAQYVSSILSKSYSMVIIANLENYKLSKKNNDTTDANGWIYLTMNLINNYYRDVKITLTQAQRAINETSRDIRPCDPDNHERGVTYERLVHFIQADLYSGCHQHTNSFDCDDSTKINTMYFDSTDEERNVEYYAVDEGPTPFFISIPVFTNKFGKFESNKNLTWKKWHVYCKTEICYDDRIDSKITVRKFSLNIAKASNGYVVTGVRLAIRNRTIYVDIQEGLFVDDIVDPQSVRWKNTTESNDNVVVLDQNQRTVSIDDIYLPKGSYVTGVKFEMEEKIMTLRVYGINKNGTVIEKTPRLHMLDLRYYREEIVLENPDVSELMPSAIEEELIGKPGKSYIRFQPTDFFKDAGQTTVPYLDIQPVVTSPPSPIQGIGVYYKGHKGYGGFIGLKLLTVDVSDKLNLDTVDRLSNNVDDVLNQMEYEELNIQLKEEKSSRIYNDNMMGKYNILYNQYKQYGK